LLLFSSSLLSTSNHHQFYSVFLSVFPSVFLSLLLSFFSVSVSARVCLCQPQRRLWRAWWSRAIPRYINTYIYTHTHTHTHTLTHRHRHFDASRLLHLHIPINTHLYTHLYTHLHTHLYTHTYTHSACRTYAYLVPCQVCVCVMLLCHHHSTITPLSLIVPHRHSAHITPQTHLPDSPHSRSFVLLCSVAALERGVLQVAITIVI
jgi:hypothetical protein